MLLFEMSMPKRLALNNVKFTWFILFYFIFDALTFTNTIIVLN
jgi:hypothetical protein